MNVIAERTQRTSGPEWSSFATGSTGTASVSSLLPEPGSAGLDGLQDGMSMMYELVAQQGQLCASIGEIGVTAQTREQRTQAQREEAALKQEEADEAKMDTGGGLFGAICHVFSDIGQNLEHGRVLDAPVDATSDVVNMVDSPHFLAQLEAIAPDVAEYVGVATAVVGAAAITTASCGTAGVAIAAVVIALSASGMLASKTHCFGKYSADIGLGLEAAGAALSFGASSAMGVDAAAQTAEAVADTTSGASDALAGASTVVVGNEQADILDDTADVQQATQLMNHATRLIGDLVAGLKAAQKSNENALRVIAGAVQTYNQSLTVASAAKA